jgi:hypothetical protein
MTHLALGNCAVSAADGTPSTVRVACLPWSPRLALSLQRGAPSCDRVFPRPRKGESLRRLGDPARRPAPRSVASFTDEGVLMRCPRTGLSHFGRVQRRATDTEGTYA